MSYVDAASRFSDRMEDVPYRMANSLPKTLSLSVPRSVTATEDCTPMSTPKDVGPFNRKSKSKLESNKTY
jgi:hypothetical protein